VAFVVSELRQEPRRENMTFTVTCNQCSKDCVVDGPAPEGLENCIVCSDCQASLRAELNTARLRDSVRSWIDALEQDELQQVINLIRRWRALKKDPAFATLCIPSESTRTRKLRDN
jgi:hypothetical protein